VPLFHTWQNHFVRFCDVPLLQSTQLSVIKMTRIRSVQLFSQNLFYLKWKIHDEFYQNVFTSVLQKFLFLMLNYYVFPESLFLRKPTDLSVRTGGVAQFFCQTLPGIELHWRKNNKKISPVQVRPFYPFQ
jgi:hypothetical protein